jgi:DNA-binding MarR family transcriptional regulator
MSQEPWPETLNFLLVEVSKLHYARSHALLEKIGLYRGQPPVLHALWHEEGLTHSELARQLHVQPATITKMVKRMEQAGFVIRRRDPEDERVSRVYLTAQGHAIRAELDAVLHVIEEGTFAGFGPGERDQMHGFLTRMRHSLMQMENAGPR